MGMENQRKLLNVGVWTGWTGFFSILGVLGFFFQPCFLHQRKHKNPTTFILILEWSGGFKFKIKMEAFILQ